MISVLCRLTTNQYAISNTTAYNIENNNLKFSRRISSLSSSRSRTSSPTFGPRTYSSLETMHFRMSKTTMTDFFHDFFPNFRSEYSLSLAMKSDERKGSEINFSCYSLEILLVYSTSQYLMNYRRWSH